MSIHRKQMKLMERMADTMERVENILSTSLKLEPLKAKSSCQVETDPDWWDCNCEKYFVHPKYERSCSRCGAKRDEQPDSRVKEIPLVLLERASELSTVGSREQKTIDYYLFGKKKKAA